MGTIGWQKLNDGKAYKIFETGDGLLGQWLMGCRYKVVKPNGDHLAFTWTVRGAYRRIARDRRRGGAEEPAWWDRRIVGEVER